MKIKIYTSTGCGKCHFTASSIQKNITNHEVVTINCDDLDDDELIKLNIRAIPTIFLEKDDTVIKRWSGGVDINELKEEISKYE